MHSLTEARAAIASRVTREPQDRAGHYALLVATLHGGGTERVVATLAAQWRAAGHDVVVITTVAKPAGAPADFLLPPDVTRLDLAATFEHRSRCGRVAALAGLLWRLRGALRELRRWHIVSFGDVTNVLALLAGLGLGLRISVAERTDPGAFQHLPRPFVLLRRWLYRLADHVIAQTERAAQWLRRECRCDAVVLPNPLRSLPAAALLAGRQPIVLAVGRLDHLKGVDTVLRAFAAARAAGAHGWRLVVLGHGPQEVALRALANQLGLGADAEFRGHVAHVHDWYACASVLAHGSRLEGFPNVLMEAMASGLAVVATDCCSGPAELITEGRDGFLVPVDDVAAMARRLQQLMTDDGLRMRIASAATEAHERFAAATVAERWLVVLDQRRKDQTCAA